MIARAEIIYKIDNYKWAVNIPILNGIPDSLEELEEYKRTHSSISSKNMELPESERKTNLEVAEVAKATWGDSSRISPRWKTVKPTEIREFTMEASVCNIGGISNLLDVGDKVIVSFENNDMGKPIILGHLVTEELENKRQNFPSYKMENLNVQNGAILPSGTTLKMPLSINPLSNLLNGSELNIADTLNDLIQFKNTYELLFGQLSSKIEALLPSLTTTSDIIGDENNQQQ